MVFNRQSKKSSWVTTIPYSNVLHYNSTVQYSTAQYIIMNCTTVLLRAVQCIIQFLRVMYLILTLQLPLTLPSVFSKTYSVFLKEDTQKCVFNNTCPRTCISQYTPMGVYWLVQALGHVLSNTHSWGLYSTVPGGDGCTVQYLEVMAVWYSTWR